MKKKKLLFLSLLLAGTLAVWSPAHAQYSAIRVNGVALATGTLNLGLDVMVTPRWSVDASGYWNPVCFRAFRTLTSGFSTGAKYWRFEPHVGRFLGVQNTTLWYDFGGRERSWKGWMTGLGASYGYAWMLAKRWNLTAEFGLGLFYMNDTRKRYDRLYGPYDDRYIYSYRRIVAAPTRAEVAVSYLF